MPIAVKSAQVDPSAAARAVAQISAKGLAASPGLAAAVKRIVSERLPSQTMTGIWEVKVEGNNGRDFSYSYPKVRTVIQQGDQQFSGTPEKSTKVEVAVEVKDKSGTEDSIYVSLLIDNATHRVLASHIRDHAEISLVRTKGDLTA
jgi:hypothetical protein